MSAGCLTKMEKVVGDSFPATLNIGKRIMKRSFRYGRIVGGNASLFFLEAFMDNDELFTYICIFLAVFFTFCISAYFSL